MISAQQARESLKRLFKGGPVERMPRKEEDLRLILALAASGLTPGVEYAEEEINDYLMEWLGTFTSSIGMDHVTVRRYLVDYCFLLRDSAGAVYTTNQTVISAVIESEARSLQPKEIYREVQLDREQRKRARAHNG